jgi:predicted transcriptional regulator
MANSGTVTVTAGGTALATNAKSSTVLSYQKLDAGTLALGVTVNGTAVSAGSMTLTGGEDVTLLVTGTTAADAVVTQIVDDNRLPTVSTKYKIRMVHAAPSLADQNLSMTIDFGAVVDSLAFAHASDWTSLTASTSSTIDVTSPADGSVFTLTDLTLLSKGLYTLFMFDTTNGLVGVLRKDR